MKKLSEFIKELEETKDQYGDVKIPWSIKIEDGEDMQPRPEGNNFVVLSISFEDCFATQIPKED